MAIKPSGRKLSEAELYSPDLDEGELDVEHYLVPDGSGFKDPYMRKAWDEALRLLNDPDEVRRLLNDSDEDDSDEDDDTVRYANETPEPPAPLPAAPLPAAPLPATPPVSVPVSQVRVATPVPPPKASSSLRQSPLGTVAKVSPEAAAPSAEYPHPNALPATPGPKTDRRGSGDDVAGGPGGTVEQLLERPKLAKSQVEVHRPPSQTNHYKAILPAARDDTLDETISSLTGIPSDKSAVVSVGHVGKYAPLYNDDLPLEADGFRLEVTHPLLERLAVFVGQDDQDRGLVRLEYVKIKPEAQGRGLGAEMLTRMAETASENGLREISLHAAGGPGRTLNGYYTWPTLGFNESLESMSSDVGMIRQLMGRLAAGRLEAFIKSIRENFPQAIDIQDVLKAENGKEWLKNNGSDLYNAVFDLRPGSASFQCLYQYLEKKEMDKKTQGESKASAKYGRGKSEVKPMGLRQGDRVDLGLSARDLELLDQGVDERAAEAKALREKKAARG